MSPSDVLPTRRRRPRVETPREVAVVRSLTRLAGGRRSALRQGHVRAAEDMTRALDTLLDRLLELRPDLTHRKDI